MDKYEIYNKYLNAINATDFNILTNISSNIGSINLMSFDVKANWESIVKDSLESKINDLKLKVGTITSEQANLNSIVSISKELKTQIEAYNNIYAKIKNISKPNLLGKDATDAEKLEYTTNKNAYDLDQGYKRDLNQKVLEIDSLILKLNAIAFNVSPATTSTTKSASTTEPASTTNTNSSYHLNNDEIVALGGVGAYNNYWRNNLENPISSRLAVLEISSEMTENTIDTMETITTESQSDLAKSLAQEALERKGGLIEMQSSHNIAIENNQELLDIYMQSNHNGGSDEKDGVLRRLTNQEDKAITAIQLKYSSTRDSFEAQYPFDENNPFDPVRAAKLQEREDSQKLEIETIRESYGAQRTEEIKKINSKISELDLKIPNESLNPYAISESQLGVFKGSEDFTGASRASSETMVLAQFARAIHVNETPGAFPTPGVSLTEIKGENNQIIGYEMANYNGPNGYVVDRLYLPQNEGETYRVDLSVNVENP